MTGDALTIRRLKFRSVVVPMARPLVTRVVTIEAAAFILIDLETEQGVTGRSYLFGYSAAGNACLMPALRWLGEVMGGRAIEPETLWRLALAADSFGKGHDVADFKPEGAAEVRQAAAAFLQMRDRIKRQIEQRTAILAGVSHDLRTPLTRMKLQLAMFDKTPEAANLESDVAAMERMIEGYLAFARGEGAEQPRPVEISGLLREVVDQMRRDGGVVDLHIEQAMTVPLRPETIRRCLSNLIGNAQRHGEHVSVHAGPRDKMIEITIDDDGPGIPPELREEAFKPFFRIEASRNPETGGVGLGLTIARDAVRNHGGDLTLEDAPGGGLRARLWLPI